MMDIVKSGEFQRLSKEIGVGNDESIDSSELLDILVFDLAKICGVAKS